MSTAVLQDILRAERDMDESIEIAKKKAERMVRDAEIYARETLEKRKAQLLQRRQQDVEEGHKKLEQQKRKRIEDTKKEVVQLAKKAQKSRLQAVDYVYAHFLKITGDHD